MEETREVLHLEHSFASYRNLDTLASRWVELRNVCNVVLEEAGKDQLDETCEKLRSTERDQGGKKYSIYNEHEED